MKARTLSCVGLLAALLVSGCDTEAKNNDNPDERSNSSGDATKSPHLLTLPTTGATNAEDDPRFEPLKSPSLPELRSAVVAAIGGDNDVVFVSTPIDGGLGDQTLWLGNGSLSELQEIPRLSSRSEQQVIGAAVTSDWVVWQEKPGTSIGVSTWSLYAFDRSTQTTRLVTTAADLAGKPGAKLIPVAPGGSLPSIVGSSVYLSALDGPSKAAATSVFAIPIAGGEPSVLAEGRGAVASGRAVSLAIKRGEFIEFVTRDLADGSEQIIGVSSEECPTLTSIGSAGTVHAWSLGCGDRDELHILVDEEEFILTEADLGYLHVSDEFVTFAKLTPQGNYAQFIFLTSSGELLPLGSEVVGGDTAVGGDLVAWRVFTDPAGRFGENRVLRFTSG